MKAGDRKLFPWVTGTNNGMNKASNALASNAVLGYFFCVCSGSGWGSYAKGCFSPFVATVTLVTGLPNPAQGQSRMVTFFKINPTVVIFFRSRQQAHLRG